MGPIFYILIALPCTIGAITLALHHIYNHLLNYTEPTYQRYIVRIIFMVPVYALMSFLSLILNKQAIYFNSVREMRFIRRCKQGCLQFVILKPILVTVTFILYAKGKYQDGNFNPRQSFLYLTIIYTISYSVALYALALFYVACKDLLKPFNPVPKFIMIKSVVFLTYWQGVLVFLAAKSKLIKNTEEAAEFQNFIICVEMLIAAAGHLFAFPYKEYAGANIGANRGFAASFAHALNISDFYHDTVHQFAPTYHDYVLYNHGDGDEGTTKYRARTFVPTGPEMDTVRRNKANPGNKSDDVNSPSSVGTTQNSGGNTKLEALGSSSLLRSEANSVDLPYELSLMDVDFSNYPKKEEPAANQAGKR
ncbi:transmembrane protein 184B-like isoform X2 [Salvia splendens]|uniref:transmembrane protein 184B-like isoform X2 n=1 Tax=Salvia splendens TaxID=180675 RepID=UPI001C25F953|nr:transmembrane protein 184B-like isoform X2 [Salvia splendens]